MAFDFNANQPTTSSPHNKPKRPVSFVMSGKAIAAVFMAFDFNTTLAHGFSHGAYTQHAKRPEADTIFVR